MRRLRRRKIGPMDKIVNKAEYPNHDWSHDFQEKLKIDYSGENGLVVSYSPTRKGVGNVVCILGIIFCSEGAKFI